MANDPKPASSYLKFPYDEAADRLTKYGTNDLLADGQAFDAFQIKVDSDDYSRNYSQLRYVTANFAGLITKLSADLLFGEPIKIKASDAEAEEVDDEEDAADGGADEATETETPDNQEWLENLMFINKLDVQLYESALGNSRRGDALFKIRVGKLTSADDEATVIIEDITPAIYFPHLDSNNVRQDPECKELAWIVHINSEKYIRKELHYPDRIENKVFAYDGSNIGAEQDLSILGDDALVPVEYTGINRHLLIHIPNWKDGRSYWGKDDFGDLYSLMYAINNRLTKTENILDKHADPILALPEGVLDENGKVKKEAFQMFEVPAEAGPGAQKPEYIVWNANLDSSFKEVDKLMQLLYMFSETSPDAFGMGTGQSDSGRALKLRLMRTIAKINRKRLYYDQAIKELLYTAQLLAKANNITVMGQTLPADPVVPEIEWADGLPQDSYEAAQEEQIRIASGNTTIVDSIMRLDSVDEETAEKKYQQIKDEGSISLPSLSTKPKVVLGVNSNDPANQAAIPPADDQGGNAPAADQNQPVGG